MIFEIELSDVEVKALRFVMADPQEWTQNAISERARVAMDEIVLRETERIIADPTLMSIPANKEEIVLNAPLPKLVEPTINLEG